MPSPITHSIFKLKIVMTCTQSSYLHPESWLVQPLIKTGELHTSRPNSPVEWSSNKSVPTRAIDHPWIAKKTFSKPSQTSKTPITSIRVFLTSLGSRLGDSGTERMAIYYSCALHSNDEPCSGCEAWVLNDSWPSQVGVQRTRDLIQCLPRCLHKDTETQSD